jgi:serine/threonine-protein kinase
LLREAPTAVAGRTPFGGESAVEIALQHVQLHPPPLPGGTPRPLERVVQNALAKDPADRYQSAVAMADALADARESAGAGASQNDTPVRGAEWWEAPTEVVDETTEIFARDTRTLPAAGRVEPTRPAPKLSPRRTVNPAARRRTVAVFVLALGVLVALLLAARALTAPPTEALPQLHGLTARQAGAKLNAKHLHATFSHEYNQAKPGTAFAQTPAAGTQVKKGSTVTVAISKGPRPVAVPPLTGKSSTTASTTLHKAGLNADVTTVPAPGTTPGLVVRQDPTAGHHLKPHDTVALFVAEVPSWHAVTSFSANSGGGQSVPFRIYGSQWRVVYSLAYNGTCDFVLFCNGPSAQLLGLGGNTTNDSFGLGKGSGKTKVFQTGPGVYQIDINPGWDDASWSIEVQDWK